MQNIFKKVSKCLKPIPILSMGIVVVIGILFFLILNHTNWSSFSWQNYFDLFDDQKNIKNILFQWSSFVLALIIGFLCSIYYHLTRDGIAFTIGISLGVIGISNILQSLLLLHSAFIPSAPSALVIFLYILTNIFSGFLLALGTGMQLMNVSGKFFKWSMLITASLLLMILTLIMLDLYTLTHISFLNEMTSRQLFIAKLTYFSLFIFIFFGLYPFVYKKYPTVITNSIFYIAIVQILIALYLLSINHFMDQNHLIFAYFLQIFVYFIPLISFSLSSIFSYQMLFKTQKKFQYLASHDKLTNLANRQEFEYQLGKKIVLCSKYQCSFALFILNLDNFKYITHSFGYHHGNLFLKAFTEKLQEISKKDNLISRMGGDEFALITNETRSNSAIKKMADAIVKALNVPLLINEKLLSCTVSLGIAIYPQDGKSTEELIISASLAMQKAKESGKNTYRFYEKKLSFLHGREAEIKSHLSTALTQNEFSLYFQPQFHLVTHQIIGAEILLRWNNPSLGQVSPEEFIPIAEKTGLIINIGQWVLKQVCQYAKEWERKHYPKITFSINVSPTQFEHRLFLRYLKNTLKKFKLSPQLLEIEITENILIRNQLTVSRILKNLDELGIKVSIDDFGMGYSSLSRLQSLPIHTLKIDKFFISEIKNATKRVTIVDTIIKLAHELGMNVIAEGVETEAQRHYLISKKCYVAQGFIYSLPLNAKDFEQLAFCKKT